MTQEALSKAVSKSRSAITNSLRLLDLPEVVQQMIFEGKLTAGHARAILAVPYEDARIRLAEKVVTEGLSVRATENLAPLFSAGETPKRRGLQRLSLLKRLPACFVRFLIPTCV